MLFIAVLLCPRVRYEGRRLLVYCRCLLVGEVEEVEEGRENET